MKKYAILAIIGVSVAGCYAEPIRYVPSYPDGYAYNQPYGTISPNLSRSHGYRHDFPAPDAYEQRDDPEPTLYDSQNDAPSDPDDVVRLPDQDAMGPLEQEEVIGGDAPPRDRSSRDVSPRPRVERHRDHSGDFRP